MGLDTLLIPETSCMNKRWITPATLIGAGVGLGLATKAIRKLRHTISLQGKVVLITGGSKGLGLALGREFARQGAHLVLCSREHVFMASFPDSPATS